MCTVMKSRLLKNSRRLAILPVAFATVALAHSPGVQLWTSATSGILYRITTGARHIEAEKLFPPAFHAQVDAGAFVRCKYSPRGGAWVGDCKSFLPMMGPNNKLKWCKFKFASRIISLTPDRIEGESEVWETQDVDARECKIQKSHMQHFVWFRKAKE
jgi:hypothetical protein